jgi:hypothetical protein
MRAHGEYELVHMLWPGAWSWMRKLKLKTQAKAWVWIHPIRLRIEEHDVFQRLSIGIRRGFCQERDYRLRIRYGVLEVTLRDEGLYSSAAGF